MSQIPKGFKFATQHPMTKEFQRIADFLDGEDGAPVFATALDTVSERIWNDYSESQFVSNKFTRSLAKVAGDLGFTPPDDSSPRIETVMTGSVDPKAFQRVVEKGHFWKDSFSAAHGEHSHSLQWMAIAVAAGPLQLKTPVRTLYQSTFNNYSAVSVKEGRLPETVPFWSWLCDAFVKDVAAGSLNEKQAPVGSFRSPQTVMNHLLSGDYKSNFLKFYHVRRYKNRELIKDIAKGDSYAMMPDSRSIMSGGADKIGDKMRDKLLGQRSETWASVKNEKEQVTHFTLKSEEPVQWSDEARRKAASLGSKGSCIPLTFYTVQKNFWVSPEEERLLRDL